MDLAVPVKQPSPKRERVGEAYRDHLAMNPPFIVRLATVTTS